MTSQEEFLFGAGQSAKFENIGDRVSGVVLTDPVTRQMTDYSTNAPKFWPSGEAMEQLIIRLLTQERSDADDDGVRVLYIDSRNKRETLRDAVKDAGGKKILVGGFIDMAYTGDGPKQGGNPPKLYAAQYAVPTQQTLALVEQHKASQQQPAQQAAQTPWAPPGQFPTNNLPQQPQPAQGFPQQPQTWGPPQQQTPQPAQPAWPHPQPSQVQGYLAQPAPQAPVPPPQPPQQAPVSYTPEIIAAIKANNQDPRSIYPDYDGRYDR